MTDTRRGNASRPTRILAALRELVGALDRRAPQTERVKFELPGMCSGSGGKAVVRIKELTGAG
jgi:hypothetical protein